MNVVDDDRRREAGEEGCGVEEGSGGLAGERERRVSMSREESLGNKGFADRFGPFDNQCGLQLSWRGKSIWIQACDLM